MKNDGKVARALSGWPDVCQGGFAPGLDAIHHADRVLLMHKDSVKAALPTCVIARKMMSLCNESVTPQKLDVWASDIRRWYNEKNGAFLPMNQIRNTSIDGNSLTENIATMMSMLQTMNAKLFRMEETIYTKNINGIANNHLP